MTFDLFPSGLVFGRKHANLLHERLPKILIKHWLFGARPPTVLFPTVDPFGRTVQHIRRISFDGDRRGVGRTLADSTKPRRSHP